MASRPSASTLTTGSTTKTRAIARAASWRSAPARKAIVRARANLCRLWTLDLPCLRQRGDPTAAHATGMGVHGAVLPHKVRSRDARRDDDEHGDACCGAVGRL